MPVRTDFINAGRYVAPVCPFPTPPGRHQRDAASVAVDRLATAGLTYIQACVAVRELRVATARRGTVGEPKVEAPHAPASRTRSRSWWRGTAHRLISIDR